jgi:gliding motility-associated-like protein
MIRQSLTFLCVLTICICNSQKNLLPDTLGYCAGDSIILQLNGSIDKNAAIQWITPTSIIENIRKITVLKQTGKFKVKVTSSGNVINDSTFVKLYAKPVKLLRDTTLCKGKPLLLDAKNPGMKFFWNTGEFSQKIKVENGGTYIVKITNMGCTVTDTVKVKFLPGMVSSISNEQQFCLSDENKILSVKLSQGSKVLWNTGATSSSINVIKEGIYWVKTENKNCGSQIDTINVKLKACDCEMIIPNSFTPNEDNRNDYFFPVTQCDYSYYTINISDRFGNNVFSSNSITSKWDGRYKGNLCSEDIYIYKIESTEKLTDKKVVRNGHISLFR